MVSAKNIKWPEDSVQGFVGTWWERDPHGRATRGALAYAWVPHVEQVPKQFILKGRSEAKDHSSFKVSVRPFSGSGAKSQAPMGLPIAAVPLHADEILLGLTAKERPVLIISDGPRLPGPIERSPRWAGKLLIAPYIELIGKKGASCAPREFVTQTRRAHYANLIWDMPPSEVGTVESILRLDCIQPIAQGSAALRMSGWRLSNLAMEVIEDWFVWLRKGGLPKGSDLLEIRTALQEL